jgi:hypothetical protein
MSQGSEGVEDVFDHEFMPVSCAYQAVSGVKAFYFFNIAGKESGNRTEAAAEKAGYAGILLLQGFKSLL